MKRTKQYKIVRPFLYYFRFNALAVSSVLPEPAHLSMGRLQLNDGGHGEVVRGIQLRAVARAKGSELIGAKGSELIDIVLLT